MTISGNNIETYLKTLKASTPIFIESNQSPYEEAEKTGVRSQLITAGIQYIVTLSDNFLR